VAVSPASVTINSVTVTITGPNISSPITHTLAASGGTNSFTGSFTDIPVGNDVFSATATDSASVSYSGSASATVTAGTSVTVAIVLVPIATQPGPNIGAPKITSASVAPGNPQPNDLVTIDVTASDPDGDALVYSAISNGCGSNPVAVVGAPSSFTWTAVTPVSGNTCTLTFTVTDPTNNTDQISVVLTIGPGTGPAVVNASVDPAPTITAITASPPFVAVGTNVTLTATAIDWSVSNTLTYTWTNTAACPGTFAPNGTTTATATTFTPNAAPASNCVFTVVVSDQSGSKSQGTITVVPGSAPTVILAPVIDTTFAGPPSLAPGATATVSATAHDPNGQTLSFTWASSVPGLGTASSSLNGAEYTASNTFTPTGCAASTVTVTATNASGLTASRTFSFTSSCAPIIDSFNQTVPALSLGATATMSLTAHDGNTPAQTLTFSWTSTDSVGLGTASSGATSGEYSASDTQTAHVCPPTTVTVTVTNASGATITHTFSFTNAC
jgi:hypothetical protein